MSSARIFCMFQNSYLRPDFSWEGGNCNRSREIYREINQGCQNFFLLLSFSWSAIYFLRSIGKLFRFSESLYEVFETFSKLDEIFLIQAKILWNIRVLDRYCGWGQNWLAPVGFFEICRKLSRSGENLCRGTLSQGLYFVADILFSECFVRSIFRLGNKTHEKA